MKNSRGFTLLEVLLVISLISFIGALGAPYFLSFQTKSDLDLTALTVAHNLRRAQLLSQGVDGDSPWGVYVQNGSITLFRGLTYATRNQTYDQIIEIAPTLSVSGLQEVVFSKLHGEPTSTGTITLDSTINQSKSLTINSKGMVEY